MKPQISGAVKTLSGSLQCPGDKSISHRALMIGGLAIGETTIEGLLEGEDVLATAAALRALGVTVEKTEQASWRVRGLGVGGLQEPDSVLDMGNSGTAARLLIGVLAGHPLSATLSGDASLSARPMDRVIEPLKLMGAEFRCRSGGRLPLRVTGLADPQPIDYRLPVASAQVKSAILLAGLAGPGVTRVVEAKPTRDHSERMLRHFGAQVDVEDLADGGRAVSIHGQPELSGQNIIVPGDISSAAFVMVAALIVQGSKVSLPGVGINPLRSGLIESLQEMGAAVVCQNQRSEAGELVADIIVEGSPLKGITVPASRAPSMIDEYPILAVAAACALGTSRFEGLSELKLKESDRLSGMARGLAACGVEVEEGDDYLVVHGTGSPPGGGATIETELDHRIAMSFLVLGMVSSEPITIDDGAPIETSFPGFAQSMNGLGGNIEDQESLKK